MKNLPKLSFFSPCALEKDFLRCYFIGKETLFIIMQNETFSYTTSPTFLQRVKSGNEMAWNEFYRKYAGMIRHIGQQKNLPPEECDDLMIEVMTIFWRKIDNFFYEPERGKFRSYLRKISDFAAMRIMRRKTREESVQDELLSEYPDELESSCMEEWQKFITDKALEELALAVDTESFQVFYMATFQNRSTDEIAAITRKSPNNIYVIRSRCLRKLREIISSIRQCEETELLSRSSKNACDH